MGTSGSQQNFIRNEVRRGNFDFTALQKTDKYKEMKRRTELYLRTSSAAIPCFNMFIKTWFNSLSLSSLKPGEEFKKYNMTRQTGTSPFTCKYYSTNKSDPALGLPISAARALKYIFSSRPKIEPLLEPCWLTDSPTKTSKGKAYKPTKARGYAWMINPAAPSTLSEYMLMLRHYPYNDGPLVAWDLNVFTIKNFVVPEFSFFLIHATNPTMDYLFALLHYAGLKAIWAVTGGVEMHFTQGMFNVILTLFCNKAWSGFPSSSLPKNLQTCVTNLRHDPLNPSFQNNLDDEMDTELFGHPLTDPQRRLIFANLIFNALP